MIFSKHKLSFRILDVFKISHHNVKMFNHDRHFGAISYRVHSDAVIEYDGKTLQMQDHSVAYFPPDTDYLRTAGIDEIYVVHLDVIGYDTHEIETFITQHPEETERAFKAIYEEWEKKKRNRYYTVSAMFSSLFSELFEECSETSGENSYLLRAIDYINMHFQDPALTIPEVAATLPMSPVYLRKLFNRELGISPKEYLTQLRLKRAKSFLLSGYYSVSEVANACGFDDEKYFSVVFRNAVGVSPSKYRYEFSEEEMKRLAEETHK